MLICRIITAGRKKADAVIKKQYFTHDKSANRRLFMTEKNAARRRAVLLLLCFFAAASAISAAPQAELWPRWEAHDPDSEMSIDHLEWTAILQRYINAEGPGSVALFDYGAVSATDRESLQDYIEMLSEIEISRYNRDEQFAFWVNLYNALTVELILSNYPLDSIRDITRPWDTPIAVVEGESVTLNDIEHRILRPIWDDPRIHYAVNCASVGCPDLMNSAYRADALEEQLDAAARTYINSPRGADFTERNPRFSSIYDWYAVDFGDNPQSLIAHLLEYAEGDTRARLVALQDAGRYRSIRYDYDWSLNDSGSF
jgi:hypothetical protein